jgi:hypothetical protein
LRRDNDRPMGKSRPAAVGERTRRLLGRQGGPRCCPSANPPPARAGLPGGRQGHGMAQSRLNPAVREPLDAPSCSQRHGMPPVLQPLGGQQEPSATRATPASSIAVLILRANWARPTRRTGRIVVTADQMRSAARAGHRVSAPLFPVGPTSRGTANRFPPGGSRERLARADLDHDR